MATSSILGGDHVPVTPRGNDIDALGPSDTSDSGSDVQSDAGRAQPMDEETEGALPIAHGSDSDAAGTGERASAGSEGFEDGADILPDRIGTVPTDADSVTDEVDDPAAASVDELAVPDDTDEEDEDEDADPVGGAERS
ncbi:conserved hypothetical protein [Burkholderiales bacterium 8X]|nr:conserved hypothetical protein [Burkholderiales bacterium 8X]